MTFDGIAVLLHLSYKMRGRSYDAPVNNRSKERGRAQLGESVLLGDHAALERDTDHREVILLAIRERDRDSDFA